MSSSRFVSARTMRFGLAFAAALVLADTCHAGVFPLFRRRAQQVPCCPTPQAVPPTYQVPPVKPPEPMPKPPSTAAATLELDIPAAVKVTVDGKVAKVSDGKETFASPAIAPDASHSFKVVVEFPGTKLPVLALPPYEVKSGAKRAVDLRKPVADWKKANELP